MNIEKLFAKIIPSGDYEHRNGFNNIPLIDKLTNEQKKELESTLIQKLKSESDKEVDGLILETLAYLKSDQALPVLRHLLEKGYSDRRNLEIAAAIFEISGDHSMIEVAINAIKNIDNKKDAYYVYKLESAFFYLTKFKDDKIKSFLEEYTKRKEDFLSYNANRALNML